MRHVARLRFAAAWASVCLPLGWGVLQTARKAIALFL